MINEQVNGAPLSPSHFALDPPDCKTGSCLTGTSCDCNIIYTGSATGANTYTFKLQFTNNDGKAKSSALITIYLDCSPNEILWSALSSPSILYKEDIPSTYMFAFEPFTSKISECIIDLEYKLATSQVTNPLTTDLQFVEASKYTISQVLTEIHLNIPYKGIL
jgi:hypothetical protein